MQKKLELEPVTMIYIQFRNFIDIIKNKDDPQTVEYLTGLGKIKIKGGKAENGKNINRVLFKKRCKLR